MIIKDYVVKRKEEIALEISKMEHKPHLLIIQVNDSPASDAYVKGKIKDITEAGGIADLTKLDPSTPEDVVLDLIDKANNNDEIDGLIVQLPLPKHISEEKIKLAVNPKKDVDGFHPLTICDPCTPKGIVDYLEFEGFPFRGANAVVIGRSNIVGKPMARLLTAKDCNVTVLHSKTRDEDMRFYVAHADLVVVAVGHQFFLNKSFELKKEAYLVDVGINRGEDGKLHGDIEPELDVKLQTPVPGGVGLLTRLTLLTNLVDIAKK